MARRRSAHGSSMATSGTGAGAGGGSQPGTACQDDTVSPVDKALGAYAGVRTVLFNGGRHDVLNDALHRTAAATVVLFLERLRLSPELPLIAEERAGLVEAARMMGLGRLGLITYVILPSALPGALVGLRYTLSTAWPALVFAEQLNADAGLGHLMSNAQQYFRTDVIVLCLVVYALLGLACDFAVRILSRRLLTWRGEA